jgi:hypothetical protein
MIDDLVWPFSRSLAVCLQLHFGVPACPLSMIPDELSSGEISRASVTIITPSSSLLFTKMSIIGRHATLPADLFSTDCSKYLVFM